MSFPSPCPGQVIRYSYLWNAEHQRGQGEGSKDRPCAVVMVVKKEDGQQMVTVLPITHIQPFDLATALKIPHATKRRLGLDDARSWVLLTEANRFIWPGPDLRMARPGAPSSVLYGLLPRNLYDQVRNRFADALKAQLARVIPRTQ